MLIRSRILPTTAKALIKPGGLLVQEVPLALGRKDDHVYITWLLFVKKTKVEMHSKSSNQLIWVSFFWEVQRNYDTIPFLEAGSVGMPEAFGALCLGGLWWVANVWEKFGLYIVMLCTSRPSICRDIYIYIQYMFVFRAWKKWNHTVIFITSRWFQILLFTPISRGKWSNLTCIFFQVETTSWSSYIVIEYQDHPITPACLGTIRYPSHFGR